MINKLNGAMQRLDEAYGILEEIFVHKSDVDLMTSAKIKISKAFFELQDLAKQALTEQEGTDGQTDRG